jgi:hypothetical protein
MVGIEAGTPRLSTRRVLHRDNVARLPFDIEFALHRTAALRQLQNISQVRMPAVAYQRVDAFGRRPHGGQRPDPAGLRPVFLLREFGVKRVAVVEHAPDEGPEAVMLRRIR